MSTMKTKQGIRFIGQQCALCMDWTTLKIKGWFFGGQFFTMTRCTCGTMLYWDDQDIEIEKGGVQC